MNTKTLSPSSRRALLYSALFLLSAALLLLTTRPAQAGEAHTSPAYAPGDIQFCPKGKAYGDTSCTAKASMANAITDAKTAAAAGISGTIYIEDGDYANTGYGIAGGTITIDGFDYGTSLVIQGGVNGGTSTFIRRLELSDNLDLDFTLVNVTLSPSDPSLNEEGFLSVNNTGDIQFDNIQLLNSKNKGASISNQTGDISFEEVAANGNTDNNIEMISIDGNIAFTNVIASNSSTGQGISINYVYGNKGITLTNVTTQNNYTHNVNISDMMGDLTIKDSSITGAVTGVGVAASTIHGKKGVIIENTGSSSNLGGNFVISSIDSSVSLNGVDASSSMSIGIFIDDISGAKAVTLTGVSASNNINTNISISNIANGVSLKDVTANTSGVKGIYLTSIHGKKGVKINNLEAVGNADDNLTAAGIDGNVSLNTVTAEESSGSKGIHVEASGRVTLSNVNASNNHDMNLDLENIGGDVNLKTVTCEGSDTSSGAYIQNVGGTKGVTLSGVNASDNFQYNLYIAMISGNVSLSAVTANASNNLSGIWIFDIDGSKGVTLKDVYSNGNDQQNILISTIAGGVGISNIEAQNSTTSYGLGLVNINGAKGVAISGANTSGNQWNGIQVNNTAGNLKLSNVQSNNSISSNGIFIHSINGSSGISLSGITADENEELNIDISDITGNASFKTVHASGSKNNIGLSIENVSGTKGLTFSNVTADTNYDQNFYINNISGSVSIKGATANGSVTRFGFQLSNVLGAKGVKISGLTASQNNWSNIIISNITGDVSLSAIEALESAINRGISIFGVYGTKGVAIKSSTFNGNHEVNLYIEEVTPGNVILTGVSANGCVTLDSTRFTNLDGTLMIISSTFNSNKRHGIYVTNHDGLVMLKYVEGSNNIDGSGAILQTHYDQLVCSSEFSSNGLHGISASADGYSITLSDVTMSGNTGGGYYGSGTIVKNESSKCVVIPAVP